MSVTVTGGQTAFSKQRGLTTSPNVLKLEVIGGKI